MVLADYRVWWESARRNPLALALGLSLLIHTGLYGTWRMGKAFGWWDHQATWLMNWKMRKKIQAQMPPATPPSQERKIIPMTFVEVTPEAAVTEPPKDTIYYGALSSRATNPDPTEQEAEKPKVEGNQEKLIRLADNPKPKPFPLQPAEEKPPPEPESQPVQESAPKPGDLALNDRKPPPKPGEQVDVGAKPARRERPRTLAEVRPQDTSLAGQKMRQAGGVKRRGQVSLDVKATPFGAYDLAFIRAVEKRWYDLLDSSSFVQQAGKVVLEFRLHYDGRITDLNVLENEVGDILSLLCQRAILDPAPYAPWPSDMRRMVGNNFREVTFTFFYN